MAEITAKAVAELRAKTNCGMMDCKKALVEANGNFDDAVKLLREKGIAKSDAKQSRIAAEGAVDIMQDGGYTAMIEVNSETDFVAKNESFREFVSGLLKTILKNKPADVAALLADKFADENETVEVVLKNKIYTIGEKIDIRRFLVVEGIVSTYIHGNGTAGVIVKFDTDAATAAKPEFTEMAKNVALQVAAMNCRYVNKDAVPESVIAEEKEILMTQIKNDPKMSSKPDAIIEKMVTGRVGKYYETNCLAEQEYVRDDSMTVGKYIESVAKTIGADIKLVQFYRYEKGEGIEKRDDNFVEEIANMMNK